MLKWQGIKFWIQKVKLHSCTTYKVGNVGLEVSTDICFRMLLKGLGLVEEACPLLVLHRNRGNTTTVYHPDNILVRLNTVRHESLELGLRNIVFCHKIIEVLPKYTLSSSIL